MPLAQGHPSRISRPPLNGNHRSNVWMSAQQHVLVIQNLPEGEPELASLVARGQTLDLSHEPDAAPIPRQVIVRHSGRRFDGNPSITKERGKGILRSPMTMGAAVDRIGVHC